MFVTLVNFPYPYMLVFLTCCGAVKGDNRLYKYLFDAEETEERCTHHWVSAISDPLKHLASIMCINLFNVNAKMCVSTDLQRLLVVCGFDFYIGSFSMKIFKVFSNFFSTSTVKVRRLGG